MANVNSDSYAYDKLIVKAAVLTISVITLTIGSCCAHVDYRISQAIEQGNDPVLARAAFSNSNEGCARVIHIANKEK